MHILYLADYLLYAARWKNVQTFYKLGTGSKIDPAIRIPPNKCNSPWPILFKSLLLKWVWSFPKQQNEYRVSKSISYLDRYVVDSPPILIQNLQAQPHFLHDRTGPWILPKNPQQQDWTCECSHSGRDNHAGKLLSSLPIQWLSRVG